MDADAGTTTTRAAGPSRQAGSLEAASAFVRAAGLVVDEVTASRVTGRRLIAHGEVRLQNVAGS